jgi:hypothetical protein
MPESSDLLGSVGYLAAAAAITLVSLVGYAIMTARRLAAARARNAALRARARDQGPGVRD